MYQGIRGTVENAVRGTAKVRGQGQDTPATADFAQHYLKY